MARGLIGIGGFPVFHKITTAVFAAGMAIFAVSQASAAMIEYSGNFNVDNVGGSFTPFAGQQGSFFFVVDYDAVDPEPTVLNGSIPGAVVVQGFTIGSETFISAAPIDLTIAFEPGFLGLVSKAEGVSSANISDVNFSLFENIDLADFLGNPLLVNEGAQFDVIFGLVALRLGTPSSVIVQGANGDIFLGSGTISGFAEFDPQNLPDPDPQQPPTTVVPVPAALPLLVSAIGAFFLLGRRRRLDA